MPAHKKKKLPKSVPLPYSIDFMCQTPGFRRKAITYEVKRIGAEGVSRRLWGLWRRWSQGWPPRGSLQVLSNDIDWFERKYGIQETPRATRPPLRRVPR